MNRSVIAQGDARSVAGIFLLGALILGYFSVYNFVLGLPLLALVEALVAGVGFAVFALIMRRIARQQAVSQRLLLLLGHVLAGACALVLVLATRFGMNDKGTMAFAVVYVVGTVALLGLRAAAGWGGVVLLGMEALSILARHGLVALHMSPEIVDQGAGAMVAAWVMLFFYEACLDRREEELRRKCDRAEAMARGASIVLHEIVPARFARLQNLDVARIEPVSLAHAPIVITDFVDFTRASRILQPSSLLAELTRLFWAFDEVLDFFEMSRIKTVGDEYQAIGGLRGEAGTRNATAIVVAMEMQRIVQVWRAERQRHQLPQWGMRIGLHAGPCYCGLVGGQRVQFDVWGETINLAHRVMEWAGEGEILASREFVETIGEGHPFWFDFKGRFLLKGGGETDLFRLVSVDEARLHALLADLGLDLDAWRREHWPRVERGVRDLFAMPDPLRDRLRTPPPDVHAADAEALRTG